MGDFYPFSNMILYLELISYSADIFIFNNSTYIKSSYFCCTNTGRNFLSGDVGTDATRSLLRLLLHQIETGAGIVARCTWHCSAAQCAQLLSLSCICSGSSEGGRWSASGALGAGSRSPQPAPLLGGCASNWSTFELKSP